MARLRAAKIPGFEGTKLLNLKMNKKLKAQGEEPVDLERDCPQDLVTRANDQYKLYLEICKQYSTTIVCNTAQSSTEQRLVNIKEVPFVVPSHQCKKIRVRLAEELPFLMQSSTKLQTKKHDLHWQHLREKLVKQIDLYFEDIMLH